MDLFECAFWISATFVSYGTIGYPLLMWVLARLAPHPIRTGSALPSVTCVLAARDESSVIGTKLGNLLTLDYPPERLDIVVVSDGSVDRTVPVVRDWIDRAPGRIRLVEVPVPQGKAHALNLGVAQARGDIVLFADARQRVDRRALRALAQNFADPRVGAVSGELVLEEQTPADPRRALASYWQFEKFLRRAESRSGTVVGCTGAIYAIRRALFSPIPEETILDDVLIPARISLRGYRTVFEEGAIVFDRLRGAVVDEFRRKVRTMAGNIQLIRLCPALLNPFRGGLAWRFLSHRVLPRVLLPYCLAVTLLTNVRLGGAFYGVTLRLQVLLYAVGVIGLIAGGRGGVVLRLPAAFIMLNAATVAAAISWARGSEGGLWQRGR